MTARLDVTPKTTEQNRIVHTSKSEAEVTNNKKTALEVLYYWRNEASYWQTRSISRGLFATAELLVVSAAKHNHGSEVGLSDVQIVHKFTGWVIITQWCRPRSQATFYSLGLGLRTYGLGLEGPGLGLGLESCIDSVLASPSNLNKLIIVIIIN